MNYESGILYISTGKKYNQEAIQSAESAKQHMPSIPIALFTDEQPDSNDSLLFNEINIIKETTYSFFDKIAPLKNTPFVKTLFVDTDTVFINSVTELFLLLDKFDLAFCHAPYRTAPGEHNRIEGIPDCFPEANTGVLVYKKNENILRLIDEWGRIYSKALSSPTPHLHDQPAFRKALYNSTVSSYVLPPEYNLRTPFPMFKGGEINAKILHGRGWSLKRAIQQIDPSDLSIRLYDVNRIYRIKARLIRQTKRFIELAKACR